jgi:endonuclease YncB( thermonuclease family)
MTMGKKRMAVFSIVLNLAVCVMSIHAADDKTYGNVTVNFIGTVYDGVHFSVSIVDWPPIAGDRIQVRVYGVNVPSMKDKNPEVRTKAREAKEYVVKRLKEGKKIELVDMRRDKYFRIIAVVLIDGKDLGEELVKVGFAREYKTGGKEDW